MKNLFLVSVFTLISSILFGQLQVEWDIYTEKVDKENATLVFEAKIDQGWHLYSQFLGEDEGPIPTSFIYKENNNFIFVGEAKEIGVVVQFDEVWGFDIAYFSNKARFEQKIHLKNPNESILEGEIEFMICNESECMPPEIYPFKIDLLSESAVAQEVIFEENEKTLEVVPNLDKVDLKNPINNECGDKEEEDKSYWWIFILGLGGGLVSLITPCVFPMIPLTVSFFTKGGSERGKGVAKALLYGLSIVIVYVSISIPFYVWNLDAEVLNQIAASSTLNMAFFIIFIVFAISFFGYFEIGLPSSWTNKADKAADMGGFFGIIFMAVVLALVSFSCTGPLLGSVLAGSIKDGPVPITVAMLGFGIGIGLPFTLFAAFPSILKSLPQSGGWLNSVKVVLGFVEVALAFKFFSIVDLQEGWGVLKYEAFLIIWIMCAIAIAIYLLGKIKFPHDSPNAKISKPRIGLATLFLALAVYLFFGFKYNSNTHTFQSLNLLSGISPPVNYSWTYPLDCPNGLICYHDLESAQRASKESGKPILVDFTGKSCTNCRRMEDNVWSQEKVFNLINDKYILVSLYVDDTEELPKEQQGPYPIPLADGTTRQKMIRTVGDKWATLEAISFGKVSQPYYALLSPEGYLLNNPVGYTPEVETYASWLECGLEANIKLNEGFEVEAKDENSVVTAEVLEPIKWDFSTNKINENEYELVMHGSIEKGWHTYSQYLTSFDGPLPTMITFEAGDNYTLIDSTLEENTEKHFDTTFDMELTSFTTDAIFKQKIKVKDGNIIVKGNINFMVCNDGKCLPPTDESFEIELK